ncbi:CusA/CzcA family heavy metal efflux RND transporter [Opitutus sp. ER46]|uniref:efflux RND transporter permease subunit n=1 Tax=Opitutus sp. ER46 TaxID=2161864 RepID=UPI000D2F87CE|nr:CusA/CzcA family heavy metal efflux RND transporter [Opitutus sp. ER46]PTX91364.1 CusA/CzcA family heavy metal efflux RND transporter [Opitutus sp. ER46]
MIQTLLDVSLRRRPLVWLALLILIAIGVWSALRLPMDSVPDITNPQVLLNTEVPALAPEEIEQLVTRPLELQMAGLPGMIELRSLSKFGLSQVRMTFEDGVDLYRIRQLVTERIGAVQADLPEGIQPKLAPISTALGEVFYYTVEYKRGAPAPVTREAQLQELKQVQEYVVSPLLRATPGVAEVNTSGGYERQIVVTPDVARLTSVGLTTEELAERIRANTTNVGGGYVEIGGEQVVVRANTRVPGLAEIADLPLKFAGATAPLRVQDVASVDLGSAYRLGTATVDGREAVLGGVMMLAGANSRIVARDVALKVEQLQAKLPAGVELRPLYNRSDLVNRTLHTVEKSLFEGAILVIAVLLALLGNLRAALIVALAIPLSMLFAVTGMVGSRVSGNLMSLGAIDFGLIIDGAVVMVENILRHLGLRQRELGRGLSGDERLKVVRHAAREVANPMFFGVLIIAVVYVPILALTGIEGKMFRPMALTVIFALLGSLVLALTVMPVLCSHFLRGRVHEEDNVLVRGFKALYTRVLAAALRARTLVVLGAVLLFAGSVALFTRLGAEFIPQLEEGTMLLQFVRSGSAGLEVSAELQTRSERRLLAQFPEIDRIFGLTGTAEIAVDPMGPNLTDAYVEFKPEATWRKVDGRPITKAELIDLMRRDLAVFAPGQTFLFTQPIQMRFNEMMAGVRADIAVKLYGDDFAELDRLATQIRDVLRAIPGGGDVEFDAFGRTPMLEIRSNRAALQRYNLSSDELNHAIRAALAGEEVGTLFEGNRAFPIVVRLPETARRDLEQLRQVPVRAEGGGLLTLGQVATFERLEQVSAITRESGQRRAAILVNLRGRDTAGFVREAMARLQRDVKLPPGYTYEFGGQFENLQQARVRLAVIVPAALVFIFFLILMSFGRVRQAALIFASVPLAVTGGVFALWLRGLPFTISAGVGFIALSGIAVLNGIMLISFINQLRREGHDVRTAVVEGTLTRLRPKLLTALVASLGFVPMALATGAGAEVQRPLATVVIGGIITSTFLTLVVLPILYDWVEGGAKAAPRASSAPIPSPHA